VDCCGLLLLDYCCWVLTVSNHQKVLSTLKLVVEMLKLLALSARILQLLSH